MADWHSVPVQSCCKERATAVASHCAAVLLLCRFNTDGIVQCLSCPLSSCLVVVQEESREKVDWWVEQTNMDVEDNVVVVKSAEGGSSIGVMFSQGLSDALEAARQQLLGGAPMV